MFCEINHNAQGITPFVEIIMELVLLYKHIILQRLMEIQGKKFKTY